MRTLRGKLVRALVRWVFLSGHSFARPALMPHFAANLTMLFTEVSALDRPGLAAQAGFDGAEILFPYDHSAKDWETALAGLPLAMINTPPGDWAAGDRGFAAVPGEESRFRDGFLRAAELASRLGAARVHVMAGVAQGAAGGAGLYREFGLGRGTGAGFVADAGAFEPR